ncbi:MAG: nucleotidyltransferase domain-containing protein, partial [bacterium]|nr:nucleotidyltransferase domain-containing protein [bacterium]
MKEKIISELKHIRENEDITILWACESGSRGWGFPSPDSDYDVRFIYMRDTHWYLSIDKRKEYLEFPITENLDIGGWDITKALRLLAKSNATVFEWLQSPIVYLSQHGFQESLLQMAQDYFCPKTAMHHYLGIAKNSLDSDLDGNQIHIKKCFYVLRPLLCAMWINSHQTIPPMNFHQLMPLIAHDTSLTMKIRDLLNQKENAVEKEIITPVKEIQRFIETHLEICSEAAGKLTSKQMPRDPLNVFFRKTL